MFEILSSGKMSYFYVDTLFNTFLSDFKTLVISVAVPINLLIDNFTENSWNKKKISWNFIALIRVQTGFSLIEPYQSSPTPVPITSPSLMRPEPTEFWAHQQPTLSAYSFLLQVIGERRSEGLGHARHWLFVRTMSTPWTHGLQTSPPHRPRRRRRRPSRSELNCVYPKSTWIDKVICNCLSLWGMHPIPLARVRVQASFRAISAPCYCCFTRSLLFV